MNRKIAFSLFSIFTALALMGGVTFAFFSGTGTSSDNIFSAGTLNLFLDDVNETATDNSVTASLTASSFVPGSSVSGHISLNNPSLPGALPIAEVEMDIDTAETADPGANSDLREVLQLAVLVDDATPDTACLGGTNVTSDIDLAVGNNASPLTLAEFDNGGVDVYDAFLTGTGLAVGATKNICFTVTFDSLAGNIYQGDAVNATLTFTANQDASQ